MTQSEALLLLSEQRSVPDELYDQEEELKVNLAFLLRNDVSKFTNYEELLDAKILWL